MTPTMLLALAAMIGLSAMLVAQMALRQYLQAGLMFAIILLFLAAIENGVLG